MSEQGPSIYVTIPQGYDILTASRGNGLHEDVLCANPIEGGERQAFRVATPLPYHLSIAAKEYLPTPEPVDCPKLSKCRDCPRRLSRKIIKASLT